MNNPGSLQEWLPSSYPGGWGIGSHTQTSLALMSYLSSLPPLATTTQWDVGTGQAPCDCQDFWQQEPDPSSQL